MKRVYNFTCAEHTEGGFLGWRMQGMDHFDPGAGLTVAHDVLEHFDLTPGIEAEMMAFGAIMYGRGQGGYYAQSYNSASKNVSYELAEFMVKVGGVISEPRNVPQDCAIGMDYIEEACRLALRDQMPEISSAYCSPRFLRWDAMRKAEGWMKIGFMAAQRRYSQFTAWDVSEAFSALEKAVDTWNMNNMEPELSKLRIAIDYSDLSFVVSMQRYPEEEYEHRRG